jgi:hypothetical protein
MTRISPRVTKDANRERDSACLDSVIVDLPTGSRPTLIGKRCRCATIKPSGKSIETADKLLVS